MHRVQRSYRDIQMKLKHEALASVSWSEGKVKRNVCCVFVVKYFPVREDEIPVLESLDKDPYKLLLSP